MKTQLLNARMRDRTRSEIAQENNVCTRSEIEQSHHESNTCFAQESVCTISGIAKFHDNNPFYTKSVCTRSEIAYCLHTNVMKDIVWLNAKTSPQMVFDRLGDQ